ADRAPGLLVRRGKHRAARASVPREDARADPADRVHAAAVLQPGLDMGSDLRLWRGRAAFAVSARRSVGGAGRLWRGAPADLAPRGADRGSADRVQPILDLVLAGGTLVLVAGIAHRLLAAGVRVRPRRAFSAHG